MEEMKKTIDNFIKDNWGTDEGERVYRWRCKTFDDDFAEIQKIYQYVMSQ